MGKTNDDGSVKGNSKTFYYTLSDEQIAWFTTHEDGKTFYAALFNCGESECEITAELPVTCSLSAHEVWTSADSEVSGTLTASVKPHGVAMFRLTRI